MNLNNLQTLEMKLERQRKRYVVSAFGSLVPLLSFFIIYGLLSIPDHEVTFPGKSQIGAFLFIGSVMVLVILQVLRKDIKKQFYATYKTVVANTALQENLADYQYIPNSGIMREEVASMIARKSYMYEAEDLIIGTYHDVRFTQSDVHAYYDVGSDTNTIYVHLISGRLGIYQYEKAMGRTVVVASHYIKEFQTTGLKEIHMGDAAFEREYYVFADGEESALYLLTSQLMECILQLGTHSHLHLRFCNGKLMVLRNDIHGMFEVDFSRKIDMNYEINRARADVQEMLQVIDILQM